jgi:two-component system nitrate/nitrite response regulator NarL
VADANAMLCQLLSGAFKRRRGFCVAACAASVKQVLDAVNSNSIDVALVGAHLRDGRNTGLRAVQQIRALQPTVRSVVLLERSEKGYIVESFRAGAKGVFFRSESDFDVLCKCIARIHQGQVWASSTELEQVVEALVRSCPFEWTSSKAEKLLTQQESNIVRLVSKGLGNREIAAQLGLSGHTVKNYLLKIFNKLGISNRVELALYAVAQEDNNHAQTAEPPTSRRAG